MAKIGFIGLGHMGHPMVINLLNAGHELTVYDLLPEVVEALVAAGANAADSLVQLAKDSDIIFTMLQTGEQVYDVCLAPDGIFANAHKDLLFIDSSSIDIVVSRDIHRAAEEADIAMLDAPVSGGVAGAETAMLTIMVGGDKIIFEQAKPILETLGKTIVHAGAAGNGQAAKICNNMILGISMIAVSEAFTLAEKLGLAAQTFFDISSQASGECWAMTKYCPAPGILDAVPANNKYQPGFTVNMMLKDLRLSQDAAKTVTASTPLGAEATSLYALFANQGGGMLDFSAIIKMLSGNNKEDLLVDGLGGGTGTEPD